MSVLAVPEGHVNVGYFAKHCYGMLWKGKDYIELKWVTKDFIDMFFNHCVKGTLIDKLCLLSDDEKKTLVMNKLWGQYAVWYCSPCRRV